MMLVKFLQYRRLSKIVLSLFLLLILISNFPSFVEAHHESLPAPERDYLKLISLHPFKDKIVSYNNYNFYITIVESAPNVVDLIFYIENSILKRPLRSPKEILLYQKDSGNPERFVLESDITGVSTLRYRYHKPFQARVKILSETSDNQPISVESLIQIGSPSPSIPFIIVFAFLILFAIIIPSGRNKIR